MSKLPPNPGSNVAIDSICYPCQRPEIIPILPVRYALGQFDLDIKDISYPTIDQLLNSDFEPVNAMVARLLRSGYVYIYIEDGAQKKEDKDADDAPSYQDNWHIFYYHSPNPDTEGNINEQGGLFVKLKIEEDDESEHLVYKRFKDKNDDEIAREYAFVPPTCSSISIAYSFCEWSINLLDAVMNSGSSRASYMQKTGVMLPAVSDFSWPLQLFDDKKPTFDDVKKGDASLFSTTLASFVQELNPYTYDAVTAKGEEANDKLVLSGINSIFYSQAKIAQLLNATCNKLEVGRVVVLHDPIGVSQDLAIFHGLVAASFEQDIKENQYAYMTCQMIETELGPALPNIDTPFSNKMNQAKKTIGAFEARVDEKQRRAKLAAFKSGRMMDIRPLQQDHKQAVLVEMTSAERKELEQASDFYVANKPTKDMEAAVAALNPKFNETRLEIAKKSKEHKEIVTYITHIIEVWNCQVLGKGSVKTYQRLLKEEDITLLNNSDKARVAIHNNTTITTMTNGLENSSLGKQQIDKILFKDPESDSDMILDMATITKAISSAFLDISDVLSEGLSDTQGDGVLAKSAVISSSNKLGVALASSPKAAKMFVDEVKSVSIESGSKNTPNSSKIKEIFLNIGNVQEVKIDITNTKLSDFIKDLNEYHDGAKKWNIKTLEKYYAGVLDEHVKVLTINGTPHFNNPTLAVSGFGVASFLSQLTIIALGVTEPDLHKLQSKYVSRAKDMLGLKILYNTVVLAEAAAYAAGTTADKVIDRAIMKALKQIKVPTSLGVNPSATTGSLKPFAFAAARNLLRTTPIIGMIDAITNYYQLRAYYNRNDIEAAAFAGSSMAGGGLLVTSAFASIGGAAFAALVSPLAVAGIVLALLGVLGKMIFENGDLENWVAEGFWGGKRNWYGSMPKYLYWNNVDRSKIVFITEGGNELPGFSAQLEIAKLISGGKGQAELPKAEPAEVTQFMRREISDYHSQRYGPNIKKNNDTVVAVLPEFSVGLSVLELKLEVTEEGFVDGDLNNYSTTNTMYVYDMPGDGEEYWQRTSNSDIFHLTPIYHTMKQVSKIYYVYYPQGKGEQTLIYKNVIEWSFFD
jgi:hypothetical protein